jgi:FkbM family methyltransferase
MLIDLAKATEQHDFQLGDVIHCGAHFGQEVLEYREFGASRMVLIEPQPKCVRKLRSLFKKDPDIEIVPCAAGSHEANGTTASMYVERHNKGQSSSLLKPLKHLAQYPKIKFNRRIEVEIRSLDSIMESFADRSRFNFLNLDVQGFELEVLKGATATIEHLDAIVMEVNRDEMYEGCAMVEDADSFLAEFGLQRVETNWVGGSWGDGLYARTAPVSRSLSG